MTVDEEIYSTASRRRRLVAEALSFHMDPDEGQSTAASLKKALSQPRPMIVSADIDGLVTAAMLSSVANGWEIVGFVQDSSKLLLHPALTTLPDDVIAVDLFTLRYDSISNHPVLYGAKELKNTALRKALNDWDDAVQAAATTRMMIVPSLWAGIGACYEDAKHTTSAKYKYPLGSAQIVLALLEMIDHAPRFYDRALLPWLVANCDGGATSHVAHPYNTTVWWAAMAAIVGPGSMTERLYDRVDTMDPHDLRSAVNGLRREREAERRPQILKDNWNLVGTSLDDLEHALRWLTDLAVWPDPIKGGLDSLTSWTENPVSARGQVYIDKNPPSTKKPDPDVIAAASDTPGAVASLQAAATSAINANFYTGGRAGSRFNWIG